MRYFNPVRAHESGLIGEDPQGAPDNPMPFVAQVAIGRRDYLNIWGNDYATPDGTGRRDYIHVADLAEGHITALDYLNRRGGMLTASLATGRVVPDKIGPRRAGDLAQYWADPGLAHELLGWKCKRGLDQMCADPWRWQQRCETGITRKESP